MTSGKVKPVSRVGAGAKVSDTITKLYVHIGDTVKKGDLIAQSDQVEQQNNVANANATLEQAKTSSNTSPKWLTKQCGYLLAFGVGGLVNRFGGDNLAIIYSPLSIMMAFAYSTLIGIVFGFLPARNSRLNPVEALSHH